MRPRPSNRIRLQIENDTHWRTSDVRKVIKEVLRLSGCLKDRSWKVTIGIAKRGDHRCGGWAYLNSGRMHLCLPSKTYDGRDRVKIDPREMAQTFAAVVEHEVAHCLGVKHRDMSDRVMWSRKAPPGFDESLVLRTQEDRSPPKKSLQVRRAESALKRLGQHQEALAEAERTLRRKKKLVSKWKKKVRYYERAGILQKAAGETRWEVVEDSS